MGELHTSPGAFVSNLQWALPSITPQQHSSPGYREQETGQALCSHRATNCSCIQAQILEHAWSMGNIHWPQSSEGFWSHPLTKIYSYLHSLLPFSTFQLHSNANNSSANGDLWQLETLLMLSHGWFNASKNILISTAATVPELTPPHT